MKKKKNTHLGTKRRIWRRLTQPILVSAGFPFPNLTIDRKLKPKYTTIYR